MRLESPDLAFAVTDLAPLPLWLGVGGVALGGTVAIGAAAVRRRRRRGRAVAAAPDRHLLDDPRLRALVISAVRELGAGLASRGESIPDLRVFFAGADRVVAHLSAPATQPPPPPWRADGDLRWTVDAVELRRWERGALPFPALVPIGTAHGWNVLVDLEQAPGLVSVTGPAEQAMRVVNALAFQLATNEWSTDVSVTMVGFDTDIAVPDPARIQHVESIAEALDPAERAARRASMALGRADVANAATGRQTGDGAALAPTVLLLAQPPAEDQLDRVARLAGDAHSAVVVVCVGDSPLARWALRATEDGRLSIDSLGLTVVPVVAAVEAHQRQLRAARPPRGLPVPDLQPVVDFHTPESDGPTMELRLANELAVPPGERPPTAPAVADETRTVALAHPAAADQRPGPAAHPNPASTLAAPDQRPGPAGHPNPGQRPGPAGQPSPASGLAAAGQRPVAAGQPIPASPAWPGAPAVARPTDWPSGPPAPVVAPPGPAPGIAAGPVALGRDQGARPVARPDGHLSARPSRDPSALRVAATIPVAASPQVTRPARLRLLGPVDLAAPGPVANQDHALLLRLAVLAAAHPDGLTDDVLAGLPPGGPTGQAALDRLVDWLGRDENGSARLCRHRGGWRLTATVDVDLDRFRRLAASGEATGDPVVIAEALGTIRGELWTPDGAAGERVRVELATVHAVVHAMVINVVRRATDLAAAAGDHRLVESVLLQGLRLLPRMEALWRVLLEFYAEHRPAALGPAVERLHGLLNGAAPEPETAALLARLAGGAAPTRTAT